MKRLIMGLAVAGMVVLSAHSEARPSSFVSFKLKAAPELVSKKESASKKGVASWYGEKFQGNPTANGEIYDMNGLTAASRELPLGTRIQVKNLNNNRSVVLRINDRGPFIAGRFLDVSKAAADRLGFIHAGLARVEIKVIKFPGSPNRHQAAFN